MRRLEDALLLLSDRAEPIPVEVLLERVETQLESEGSRPVAAHGEEPTMTIHYPPEARPAVHTQPQRQRRGLRIAAATAVAVVTVSFGIAIAAGWFAGESEDGVATRPDPGSTSIVPSTSEVPPPTSVLPALTPAELADRLWAAHAGSDPAAWLALFPEDHGIFGELDWEFLEDYDGDGQTTMADWQQFQIALHGFTESATEWTCETVSADTARCTVSGTDAFYELGGAAPPTAVFLDTFEAGLLIAEETVEPANPEQWEEQRGIAEDGRERELRSYQDWVFANHPDAYSRAFDGSPEGQMVDFVVLPAALGVHEELMPAYLAAARGSDAGDAPATGTGTITVVAQEWTGLEGHQVLVAAVPGNMERVRSLWADSERLFPRFIGSLSWGSVLGDPFSGEEVIHPDLPFAWFMGQQAPQADDTAQLSPGPYTLVFMTPGRPGPIYNWADDYMPYASRTCVVEVEVAADTNSRVVVTDVPSSVEQTVLPLCPQG